MVKRSEKFYPIDYTELKRQLDAELNRRGKSEGAGQGQSVGSVSAHIQNYSAVPESGAYIVAEHIQKITNPLSAITGSSITPENGSKVTADVLSKAAAVLSQLSAVPENAASSGCAGACSRALHNRLLLCLLQLYRVVLWRMHRFVHKELRR